MADMSIDPRRIEVMDPEMAEIMRQKTPAEKLAMSFAMWKFARTMIVNVLRTEHPDWNEDQILREAARRLSQENVLTVSEERAILRTLLTSP